MSFKSVDKLTDVLLNLHLVSQVQLDDCLADIRKRKPSADDLLTALERRHFLTSYQLSKLRKAESDGLVLGRHKLLYRNASGSFARVFRAVDIEDGSTIGIKLLRQRWAADPEAVVQFHREAELCKCLQHDNIVPIYEVGNQGEYHYFTMEFVEGGNLRDFLKIRKKLSPLEATRCALHIARGLEYALGRGVTHRDMKLTNVLMSITGVAKLVDFGLAGHVDDEASQRALEYATIERGTGSPPDDPRTDLFFLGAIFFELLTGKAPYPPSKRREDRKQFSRYRSVPAVQSVAPDVPRPVADVVEKLLQINPAMRYQTATELIKIFESLITNLESNGQDVSQTTLEAGSAASPVTSNSTPTVMCIENRPRQQDLLREYLSNRGYRVLVLSDMQRGIARLRNNPPDCIVLMGDAIGDGYVQGFQEAATISESSFTSILVLPKEAAAWKDALDESETERILVQPISLRDLREEIHEALGSEQVK